MRETKKYREIERGKKHTEKERERKQIKKGR